MDTKVIANFALAAALAVGASSLATQVEAAGKIEKSYAAATATSSNMHYEHAYKTKTTYKNIGSKLRSSEE